MIKDPCNHEERARNLIEGFAEFYASATDEEIEEIMKEEAAETGVEPAEEAERVRRLMLDTVARSAGAGLAGEEAVEGDFRQMEDIKRFRQVFQKAVDNKS